MAIDFASPSYRASSSDLTVQVSPLGLVELADEEFEVHGPRLNRYANNWAWYLGHHWGYRREVGEPQMTFNYVKAFSDYITNFCFGKAASWRSPQATEAIVPMAVEEVWSVDNDKPSLMWEIGNLGSVSGDVFVKVAYEEPWRDPAGFDHPGRIRLIPLNPSYCLPTDRTEILTRRGWVRFDDLSVADQAMALDPKTDHLVWADVEGVNVFDWDGPMHLWQTERFTAMTTPDHQWIHRSARGKVAMRSSAELSALKGGGAGSIVAGGGIPVHFPTEAKYSDEFVELVGWVTTEGSLHQQGAGFYVHQAVSHNPEFCSRIDRLAEHYRGEGLSVWSKTYREDYRMWYFPAALGHAVRAVFGDDKDILPEFLTSLTFAQANLLYNTLLDADGDTRRVRGEYFFQNSEARVAAFQMLAMMLGRRSQAAWADRKRTYDGSDTTAGTTTVYKSRLAQLGSMDKTMVDYKGTVWCPTTSTGTWVVRYTDENGRKSVFHTGNCFPEFHPHDKNRMIRFKLKYRFWGTSLEGTRQVFTYTELVTDSQIEEYINDELIDSRPNPIGEIPIVHIANIPVSGSPWGLSDIQDIIPLNREFNEKATDVSDIINYHAAPITVITGAKSSGLEKGAKKVWAGLPKDANVFNLELGAGLEGPLAYMDRIKRSMHELTGVPESALGQMQPISNTSGVALAIQYQPLMNRRHMKVVQYGKGIARINELIIKHLFLYKPEEMQHNPLEDAPLKPGQLPVLDPRDPMSYRTTVHFPDPLPLDALVKLNEIQAKMALGLESKRGALRLLGEEFVDEKLQELFTELVQDTKEQGALDMLTSTIRAAVMVATGFDPMGTSSGDGGGPTVSSAGSGEDPEAAGPLPGPMLGDQAEASEILNEITTLAYGTKLPQTRNPDNTDG